jgi:glycosyltransferase involved in cell wall biosynthesis
MIVKNEETNLPRCLDSARELAREIVVVDTGSTDQTPAIAACYGAKVLPFDFRRVDFAAARNHAMAQASGRWILMLDADEILDPTSAGTIGRLVAADENAGYFLERRNHSSDSGGAFTDYVVRLFPNRPDYRYRGRVHETIDASILASGGRLIKTGVRIDHRFSSDRQQRRGKNLWYIEILKEEIAADPSDYSRLDFLAAEYHQLEMFEEATAVAERIVAVRPLDPRAHLFLGIYHLLHKADLTRARADFQQALRLRPGYAEAQSFLELTEEHPRRLTSSFIERETRFAAPAPRASAGDRVEKPRHLFASCSRFIRLGGFFMKFRGRNAHPNRPGGLSHIAESTGCDEFSERERL